MRGFALSAIVVSGWITGGTAYAAQNAYCLKTSEGPGDCKYATYAQCAAALSGAGGVCQKNPASGGDAPGGWIPHGANERPLSDQTTSGKSR